MILEWIHYILGNPVQNYNIKDTYVYKYDPWSRILAAEVFAIHSTENGLKVYSLFQLLFRSDIILLVRHKMDWKLIHQ